MRTVLIAAVLAGACGSTGEAPAAAGSLVFDPPANGAAADVFLATEAEVLKSQPLRERVTRQLRLEAPLAAESIIATPKPGTLVLDVGVRDPDPRRAAELCNTLLRTYVEYRMERALIPMLEEEKALAEQLERRPEDAKLRERVKELELARRAPRAGVRLLDACRPATASRR